MPVYTIRRKTKAGVTIRYMADYWDRDAHRQRPVFKKKADAKAFLKRVEGEVQAGTHTPDSKTVTVREACQAWLDRAERETLETATIRQYENHVNLHICPENGGFTVGKDRLPDLRLTRLTTPIVETFRDYLLEQDFSRPQAAKILTSFKAVIKEAKRLGWIIVNVAEDVVIKNKNREAKPVRIGEDIPTRAEMRAIIDAAINPWRPLLITAAFTGLRSSELRGLLWEHIVDLDGAKPHIDVRQRADEKNKIGPCKSKAGYRQVPLGPNVVGVLKAWHDVCPRMIDAEGNARLWLIFPNGKGRVENHSNIENRGLYVTQERAGVVVPKFDNAGNPVLADGKVVMTAKYSMHALRHFFASLLIDAGANLKRVQYLMGHESVQLTLDTYTHLFHDADDHAMLAGAQASVMGTSVAIAPTPVAE